MKRITVAARLAKVWHGQARLYVFLCAAIAFVVLNGFSCGQGNNFPGGASTGAPGFRVGLGFGPDPRFDSHIHGDVNDPCQYFTGGIYKVRKIIIEVFRFDEDDNEVAIYDPIVLKDGVHFANGNPRTPLSGGVAFKIPEYGAFKVRVRVWGYDCEDLPHSGFCLDCCDDEAEGPYWEETSPWQDNQKNDYATGYVTYPKFIICG